MKDFQILIRLYGPDIIMGSLMFAGVIWVLGQFLG